MPIRVRLKPMSLSKLYDMRVDSLIRGRVVLRNNNRFINLIEQLVELRHKAVSTSPTDPKRTRRYLPEFPCKNVDPVFLELNTASVAVQVGLLCCLNRFLGRAPLIESVYVLAGDQRR